MSGVPPADGPTVGPVLPPELLLLLHASSNAGRPPTVSAATPACRRSSRRVNLIDGASGGFLIPSSLRSPLRLVLSERVTARAPPLRRRLPPSAACRTADG